VSKPGTLYVVGTPIGNLEDITYRAVRVLGQVSRIAAEDTRTARILLGHYGIDRPLTSYFDANEAARADELVAELQAGADVALISEAGMPGVSDPGFRLVAAAVAADIRVVPIPGPSAALAGLVASGLATDRFFFVGFLPRAGAKRDAQLAALRPLVATLIVYEAPSRTGATLADMAQVLGGTRRAVVARELTKLYEELVRGTLAELGARYADEPPRGEVTLLVEGAAEDAAAEPAIDIEAEVRAALSRGESPKQIAAVLALRTGKPRRMIYQLALAFAPRR
jgi:16S rRNA (cytidine1402-2'-O)-methyltransferase